QRDDGGGGSDVIGRKAEWTALLPANNAINRAAVDFAAGGSGGSFIEAGKASHPRNVMAEQSAIHARCVNTGGFCISVQVEKRSRYGCRQGGLIAVP
ncbi:MAG: hypothetical protein K0U74_17310, partial [Alphaproteobacteria bacterium]|nr:hypothetical protein [Alphaproteobacteria bacterium]